MFLGRRSGVQPHQGRDQRDFGLSRGTAASAKYDLVSSGATDHAEAVKVTYDPSVVRYDQLLRVLFSVIADPTLKNRQGPDVGRTTAPPSFR